jgi:hypothetical protein
VLRNGSEGASLYFYAIHFQGAIPVLGASYFGCNRSARGSVWLGGPIGPAFEGCRGLGISRIIELKRLVGGNQGKHCSGTGWIAGGGALWLVALGLGSTTGIYQFTRKGLGQCQGGENGYNRTQRKESSHLCWSFLKVQEI